MSVPTWAEYGMNFAIQASTKSKDTTKVGCAIIGPDDEVRITGFNGIPRGVAEPPERLVRPEKYYWFAHAEENAVALAARIGTGLKGCTAYVTHTPCFRCARILIGAGINKVVIAPGVTSMDPYDFEVGQIMFREAGVEVVFLGQGADPEQFSKEAVNADPA